MEIEQLAIEPTGDSRTGLDGAGAGFRVHLDNFEGPFDLLLA